MKKVIVGGMKFTLLDDDEVECEHEWKDIFKHVYVNPGGEYVVGYGYTRVTVQVKNGRHCIQCGKREEDDRQEGEMKEKVFYGIWNGKKNYWEVLSHSLGLFTEHLRITRGSFHNIRQKYDYCWENVDYQIRRLGGDGRPVGEPLDD